MIPVNEPLIGEKEIEYVLDCLRTGWISSSGKYLESFEQAWADYCGMRYGIAVSNGTTALQVAVACLGLQPGDEVILPTFTIISCAQAVTYNGGIPVLVDSEPRTWCMDVSQLAARITPRTTGDHAGPHLWSSGGYGSGHFPGKTAWSAGHRRCCRSAWRRVSLRTEIPPIQSGAAVEAWGISAYSAFTPTSWSLRVKAGWC